MILGFDISSTCVGWSILDNSGNLEKCGHIDLSKFESNLFLKLDYFTDQIKDILEEYKDKIDIWGVEEAAKKFQSGKSSAQVISVCISFNFGVSYTVWKILGKQPVYIPVNSARNMVGLKIPRGLDKKLKKSKVVEWCKPRYSSIEWPLTKQGNYKSWCGDVADSLVLAEATRLQWMTNQSLNKDLKS